MTTDDGRVRGTVQVVDHGPGNTRWDLVILGDGYRATELRRYQDDVERFCFELLQTTHPFDELWPAINVHRVDVTSTDSGADDPCDPEGPVTARTFFDAIYCDPMWSVGHLLTVDEPLARRVASTQVPLRNAALVLVNDDKYGGSGSTGVAVSARAVMDEIALHELGHSAFGLADEYEGDESGGVEPAEPNVTCDAELVPKWRDLVEATTPLPTAENPDCGHDRPLPGYVGPNAVGTYEGARYQRCGIYRPFPDCTMRTNHTEFCPVCVRVIRRTLRPFLP